MDKKRLRGRRKRFMALCLAIAMIFCYQLPAFAKDYTLNPDYKSDEPTSNPSYDEDIVGKTVKAGDTLTFKHQTGSDDTVVLYYKDDTNALIEEVDRNETKKDIVEEIPVALNGQLYFSDDDGYADAISDPDAIRAWEVNKIAPSYASGLVKYLYVTLTPVDSYVITYHVDGESYYGGFYLDNEGKALLSASELSANGITLSEGTNFIGWYTDADLSGTAVTAVAENETGNKDFYAKLSYDITFVTNGGQFDDSYVVPEIYTSEDEIILPEEDVIGKEGYQFEGWYDNANLLGEKVTIINTGSKGAKTFYAKYNTVEYDITFVTNDGVFDEAYEVPAHYTVNDEVILPTKSNISKFGTRFYGWYDNKDFVDRMLGKDIPEKNPKFGTIPYLWRKNKIAKWGIFQDEKGFKVRITSDPIATYEKYGQLYGCFAAPGRFIFNQESKRVAGMDQWELLSYE